MKSINNYISEKLIINKNTKLQYKTIDDIFEIIDPKEFEWYSAYSEDSYLTKCKNNVRNFANEFFKDMKPIDRLKELWKQTYKQYVSSTVKSETKVNMYYENAESFINKFGWAQYESFSLEQGWWVFMYWVIKKIDL